MSAPGSVGTADLHFSHRLCLHHQSQSLSENLVSLHDLTRLSVREDFIAFKRREPSKHKELYCNVS